MKERCERICPLTTAQNDLNRRPGLVAISKRREIHIPVGVLVWRQRRVVAIERRAVGAHILDVVAHVTKDMRMVLRWQRTHAHEFLGADLDDWNA